MSNILIAEESGISKNDFRVGGYLGGNLNMHSPNVDNLDNANGFGINVGGLVDYHYNKMWDFGLRLGYHSAGAEISDNFDASLGYLEISPIVKVYNLIPVKEFYFLGGFEMGINLNASYDDGTNEQDIEDPSFRMGLAIGIGYNYKLNENWLISPEVSFRLPFTNISSATEMGDWKINQIRFGVNISYGFAKEKAPADPESVIDVGMNGVYYYDTDKTKKRVDNVVVEEVQYSELFPLVPYIFLEKNKAVPSSSSQKLAVEAQTGGFSIESLEVDAIEINKSTLDIIGERLTKYPNSAITITGNISVKDGEDKSTAQKRADFAKNYLVINYGVNPANIKTVARELPKKASGETTDDGRAENRRIEIQSSFSEVLEPIIISKDKQSFASPKLIEFDPIVKTSDSVVSWNLEISQADRLIKKLNGQNVSENIQWDISANSLTLGPIPIDYHLSVTNSEGRSDSHSGSIPIEFYSYDRKKTEQRADKTISKFSLIVFDFDSPNISTQDQEILKKHVLPAIKYNSNVQIYGYSDRIGEKDYNRRLALARAENAKSILEANAKSVKFEVYGIGENLELYDNELPIGRQLSRTVQIYIITPKEK
jgi:outer membrane protein OmpA-like peptidoglycan-associated protein/opacity protein-like surface antigen